MEKALKKYPSLKEVSLATLGNSQTYLSLTCSDHSLVKAWKLESTNGESFTLTFDSFDVEYLGECKCCDYVKIRDEVSTQKFCSNSGGYYQDGTYIGTSIIGPFTGTTMTVTFYSDFIEPKGGFLATICCSVNVTRLTCTYNSDGTSAICSDTGRKIF